MTLASRFEVGVTPDECCGVAADAFENYSIFTILREKATLIYMSTLGTTTHFRVTD